MIPRPARPAFGLQHTIVLTTVYPLVFESQSDIFPKLLPPYFVITLLFPPLKIVGPTKPSALG